MSYLSRVKVEAADSPSVDAFGRWRTSSPSTVIFDSQLQYDLQSTWWETVVSGAGSVSHVAAQATARLTTGGGTTGALAARQTRSYFRYQPGKSQLILLTGVMGALKANVRQRIGYFDAGNGLFFEQDGTTLKVVQRSNTSGAPADTAANQADWNLDPLDGTGRSGVAIDTSKNQIFVIDFEWLGAGRARMGFFVAGVVVYCHEFLNANVLAVPYMATANLPLRYEIENTGAASGATTLDQVCCAVVSEGGADFERAYLFSASNGVAAVNVTGRRAVLSIRPKTTFNSIANRSRVEPLALDLSTSTQSAYWELVYNPTFTGTPVWADVDATYSAVERSVHGDAAAGAISSGGIVLDSGYVIAGSAGARVLISSDVLSRLPIVLDAAGANPIPLSLVCTAFTGTASILSALSWREIR